MNSDNNYLEIEAVIGYKGDVIQGLLLHPDNEHIIFSLGSTVIVRDIVSRGQTFLRGHDNEITCLAISPSGKFIASGQKTHSGFNADIMVWDFAEKKMVYKLTMHKVCIRSLCFSPGDNYLASVGGLDDKNTLIVWDLNQSEFRVDCRRQSGLWNQFGN
jgi:WD40 repeat protein